MGIVSEKGSSGNQDSSGGWVKTTSDSDTEKTEVLYVSFFPVPYRHSLLPDNCRY